MKLSENLITLRQRRGISQENFGLAIGVSRQAVSKWETGESTPDIDKLEKISAYYGITIDALLHGHGLTNKTMDICLLISTGINLSVIIITALWWNHSQTNWSILTGSILLVLSMMLYGYTRINHGSNGKTTSIYWMINIWLVPFLPMALFYNLLIVQIPAPYPLLFGNHWLSYMVYWIIYILVGAIITLKMVRSLKPKQK